MGWIEDKSVSLNCPYFADVFEGCEPLEGLQPEPIIICVDEVVEVGSPLSVAVIMVSLDGSVLAHLLDGLRCLILRVDAVAPFVCPQGGRSRVKSVP